MSDLLLWLCWNTNCSANWPVHISISNGSSLLRIQWHIYRVSTNPA